MDTKDLGTYHVKVQFTNGDGFIYTYNTGLRYTNGTDGISPLSASLIKPTWPSEDELLRSMVFMFTGGNYSCDCNRLNFLDDAHQRPRKAGNDCGDTLVLQRLTAIRPDASEVVIYEVDNGQA